MTKYSRLISWPAFAVIIVIICAMFYALFPKHQFFVTADSEQDPVLLIPYLRAALVNKPDDQELEQRLIKAFIRAQKWPEAISELSKLTNSDIHHQLYQQVIYHRWTAHGAHHDRDLDALIASFRPVSQWSKQSVRYATAAGLQGAVAEYYQRHNKYGKAAQFWMQDDNAHLAVENYKKSISSTNYKQAIQAALADQHPKQALLWWQKFGDVSDVKHTLKLAKFADDRAITEQAANTLVHQFPNNESVLREAVQAQIGNHDLSKARVTSKKLLFLLPKDKALHHQLWQIAMWSDDITLAMHQLQWLIANDPLHSLKSAKQTLHTVDGLFLYQDKIVIYRFLSEQHKLTKQDFNHWMSDHYYLGDSNQMVQDIHSYERLNGKSLFSQYWLLKALYEQGHLSKVRHLWAHYQGPDTAQTHLWFARAFWLNNQNEKALKILASVSKDPTPVYWDSLAQVAEMVGNDKLELLGYSHLKQLGPVSLGIELRYRQLRFGNHNKALLHYLWHQPVSDSNLVAIAQVSMQLQDRASMAKLAPLLAQQKPSPALASAWSTLGQWYQSQQQYSLAKQMLLTAQNLAPNLPETALSLGWLAVDSNNKADAQAILSAHQSEPMSLQWAPLLSSLALELGDYRLAYRYLRWCIANQPSELSYWVNLSDVLTHMHMKAEAWKVNRYLIGHLPHTQADYQQLLAQWGGAKAYSYLRHYESVDNLAITLSEQPQAQWWLHRRAVKLLPSWQQLQQAMQDGQFTNIRQLVAKKQLAPIDKVNALIYLRQPYRAMQNWLVADQDSRESVNYDLARSVRSSFFHAVELSLQPNAGLSSSAQQFNVYFPAAQVQWKIGLAKVNNLGNDGQYFLVDGHYLSGRWDLEGQVDYFHGALQSRNGLTAKLNYQSTQRLRLGASLGWHTRTDQSDLLLAFAQQNQLELSAEYLLSPRQQLNFSASQWQITLDSSNKPVASGQQYQTRYSYQILNQDPLWGVYSAVNWQQLSSSHIRSINGQEANMSAFRRIALGTTLGPGLEFNPPYLGLSPTWQIDLSGGYQPNVKQLDFAAVAGIGWSIISDDLLSVQTRYQTRSRSGKSDLQLQLNYYVHF
ncbi:tetratricopeptide repeat protein [Celerinatantimonas sp. MCCC 1A17872]|uniref:tetratricopeptide repeat protein n=1 Tax=Celerinatantimonas sp. MCCC 1A17872 TaxID=3177514 RepID=UPI0038CB3075